MIETACVKRYCCEDISKIENYGKAVADSKMWDCHHRRETFCPRKRLIQINEYFKRPAAELIFLTHKEHMQLHKIGNNFKRKGRVGNRKGCTLSEETKMKMRQAKIGKPSPRKGSVLSQETRLKISQSRKGFHWYNDGIKSIQAKSCPKGFKKGRI